MPTPFSGFDLADFWEGADYPQESYIGASFTGADVAALEAELGYKLPVSYLALMRSQNGGVPKYTNHRTSEPTLWAPDHVSISGLYAIGRDNPYSLGGEFNSKFWQSEWDYPPIGIYFADTPTGGHDMLCLDYRECGPAGEPQVVHVDQERNHKITFVAPSFEAFIRGLENDDAFDFGPM